ncbi:Cysteine-rich secretory protein 3 [Mactra antiquata]
MGEFPRQWRQYFVDWHNEFRRSQGAANMCRMQWSDSLAQQADEWVSNCEFNGYYGNGMNFAHYTGENNMENMRKVFQEWAGERDEYDFSGNGCGNSCRYTQMVWYNTREIGCSVRRCPNFSVYDTVYENAWYMACSYAPRGNMYNDFYNNGEMSMNNNMNGYQFFYPFMRGQACQFCNECEDGLCVGEYNSDFNNWNNGNGNWNFNSGFSNWNNWNQNNEWNNNGNSNFDYNNWNFNNWNSDYVYSNWNSNNEWNNNWNFNNGFSNWNNWYNNNGWNNNFWNNGYNNWNNNDMSNWNYNNWNNNGMSNWNNNGFSNWNNWYNQNNDYGYWNFNSNWNNFGNYRCQDMKPYCMMWRSQGQCESNNYYMMKYCPQSCDYCGWYQNYFQNYNNFDNWNEYFNNYNGWNEYYTSNYYNKEYNNEECTNESSECEQYGSQVCFNRPYWARRNCRQMCNFC